MIRYVALLISRASQFFLIRLTSFYSYSFTTEPNRSDSESNLTHTRTHKTHNIMAFLTSTVVVSSGSFTRPALSSRTAGVSTGVRGTRSATIKTTPRMETDWTGPPPPSSVLGIGKDIGSSTFVIGSVVAFALGVYCCYESNLLSPLTPEGVNPLYVLGSLGLPISWGM